MKVNVKQFNKSDVVFDLEVKEVKPLTNLDLATVTRVRNQNEKQGTKKVKDRSEVRGHAAKPFKQKGTGRARQGSTKGPHHVGGGIAHGPTMDTTKLKLTNKYKSLILKKMLVESINNENLMFVDLTADKKTLRNQLNEEGKVLVVFSPTHSETVRGFRNVSNLELLGVLKLSTYKILNYKTLLFDIECKDELAKILSK